MLLLFLLFGVLTTFLFWGWSFEMGSMTSIPWPLNKRKDEIPSLAFCGAPVFSCKERTLRALLQNEVKLPMSHVHYLAVAWQILNFVHALERTLWSSIYLLHGHLRIGLSQASSNVFAELFLWRLCLCAEPDHYHERKFKELFYFNLVHFI